MLEFPEGRTASSDWKVISSRLTWLTMDPFTAHAGTELLKAEAYLSRICSSLRPSRVTSSRNTPRGDKESGSVAVPILSAPSCLVHERLDGHPKRRVSKIVAGSQPHACLPMEWFDRCVGSEGRWP